MGLLHRLLSGHVRPADCPNKGLPGHERRIIGKAIRRYLEGSVRDWEVLADIIPVPRRLCSDRTGTWRYCSLRGEMGRPRSPAARCLASAGPGHRGTNRGTAHFRGPAARVLVLGENGAQTSRRPARETSSDQARARECPLIASKGLDDVVDGFVEAEETPCGGWHPQGSNDQTREYDRSCHEDQGCGLGFDG
jgi:hypothetical protein